MARAWTCAWLAVLLWSVGVLADGDDLRYEVGDFVTVVSTAEGPLVSFFYSNGSSICTSSDDATCAVYSFRVTGVYETVDGVQVEDSGVGLASLPWVISFQQLLNDPLCGCTAMVFNVTNDGSGAGGAWDSLAVSVHIPEAVGTTHALVEVVVDNFQWRTPGHLEVANLVLDTTLVANDADGVSTNAELLTDQSTTAMVDNGYVTLSPSASAVAEASQIIVGAQLNVTANDVQLVYQGYPDGYELRSQLRLGINSASDPAILPYNLDSYVSQSDIYESEQPEGSMTWLNWLIGIALGMLVLCVAVIVVTGLLWMHQPSRRFLQRVMNRHTVEEEGGLIT